MHTHNDQSSDFKYTQKAKQRAAYTCNLSAVTVETRGSLRLLAPPTELVSSEFIERLTQNIRYRTTEEDFQHRPLDSTCMYVCMHEQLHTYTQRKTKHKDIIAYNQ